MALENLGTFQDGGLQHNNPLKLALWEVKFLWPDKAQPDFALSVGTGMSNSFFKIGPQSPVKKRFVSRIFDTFMDSMDGEKLWREFYNTVSESERGRYHRMNLTLQGSQPALDDSSIMETLETQAADHVRSKMPTEPILDSMLASAFYFEFDSLPQWKESSYLCHGHIFCRLPLSRSGRKTLLSQLAQHPSYFALNGDPVACVERVSKPAAPYKRKISFRLNTLRETVAITLRGVTSKPHSISGLPKSANAIIKAQRLTAPFGRCDNLTSEKKLPSLPRKRKLDDVWI